MLKTTVSRGATVNLGSYESARVDISMEFDTESGMLFDDMDHEVVRRLRKAVQEIQTAASLPPHPTDRFTG